MPVYILHVVDLHGPMHSHQPVSASLETITMSPLFAWCAWLAVTSGLVFTSINAASLPSCQAVAPNQTTLHNVLTTSIPVPQTPFGLVYANNDIAFVSLSRSLNGSTLGVFNTSTFAPVLIHQITLPPAYIAVEGASGIALTHDGRHVIVAAGPGAVVIDVARAVAGRGEAVVGTLNGTIGDATAGDYAIEVTITRDDEYVFVSQEYGISPTKTTGNIDVFRLHRPTANGTVTGTAIGHLSLDIAVVGTALSPDDRFLYAVSEDTSRNDTAFGTLSVIDVNILKTAPSKALLHSVPAGCGPVRLLVSSDGEIVWVTARESNHLLAFSARKLQAGQHVADGALLASVQVGTSPVGLTFAAGESRILTADSDRFLDSNATTGLSVIDIRAALSNSKDAVLGRVPTGLFPREFAVSPDGSTILVADYTSQQIQSVNVATLT